MTEERTDNETPQSDDSQPIEEFQQEDTQEISDPEVAFDYEETATEETGEPTSTEESTTEPSVDSQEETRPSWMDKLESHGIQDISDNPEEAIERLTAILDQQQSQENDRFSVLEQHIQELSSKLRDSQTEQTSQPESSEEGWFNPPKLDENYKYYVEDKVDPETGETTVGWKENTPPHIVQNYIEHEQYKQAFMTDLLTSPDKVLPSIIEHEAKKVFNNLYQQQAQAQAQQSAVTGFTTENQDWLYAKDPRTNGIQYGHDGAPVLSQDGEMFAGFIDEAINLGINSVDGQLRYAQTQYDNHQLRSTPTQQVDTQTAKATAAEKNMEYLKKQASQGVTRDASNPPPSVDERPANPNMSPEQDFQAVADALGIDF